MEHTEQRARRLAVIEIRSVPHSDPSKMVIEVWQKGYHKRSHVVYTTAAQDYKRGFVKNFLDAQPIHSRPSSD